MAARRALFMDSSGRTSELPTGDTLVGAIGSDDVATIRKITQAAYDALGTKDAQTLYIVVGS